MDAIAVAVSVAVLAVLVVAVIRRVVLANVRTVRHGGMSSTSADRRRPSGRLPLLSNVALGLFTVALALYLLVAAWPGADAGTTHGAGLMIDWGVSLIGRLTRPVRCSGARVVDRRIAARNAR